MTRQEIEDQYTVNENGIITSPGKFEGEMYYAIHYWDLVTDGFSFSDDDGISIFYLDDTDITEYPELQDAKTIKMWEDDIGFVHCQTA